MPAAATLRSTAAAPEAPVSPGRVVALTGINGAGKSTLAEGVRRALAGRGEDVVVRKLRLFDNPAFHHYEDVLPRIEAVDTTCGRDLCAALIVLESVQFATDVAEEKRRGRIVLCDRYATCTLPFLTAYGYPERWAELLAGLVPAPDAVCHLAVPVEVTVERRRRLGEEVPPEEVTFLRRMAALLHEDALARGGLVLDAELPPDVLVDRVLAWLDGSSDTAPAAA